jgi:hypothetical protein
MSVLPLVAAQTFMAAGQIPVSGGTKQKTPPRGRGFLLVAGAGNQLYLLLVAR